MASTCLLLHKPYGVLSQFTPEPGSRWDCLASFVPVKGVYAAGRLDADSEGLLLLTSDGQLQHQLTNPRFGHWRQYRAQVEEHQPDLEPLRRGLQLKDGPSRPARAQRLDPRVANAIAERNPPIRHRLNVPTTWLQLELRRPQPAGAAHDSSDWLSHAAADPLEPGSDGRPAAPLVRGPGARPVALAFPPRNQADGKPEKLGAVRKTGGK